ncbi:MAG: hypothetical protein WBA59_06825 [Moheibacter sp.]
MFGKESWQNDVERFSKEKEARLLNILLNLIQQKSKEDKQVMEKKKRA